MDMKNLRLMKYIVSILIAIIPLVSNATIVNIGSMNITSGTFDIDINDGAPASSFNFIGPNTNLVGGYIGNGGAGLSAGTADSGGIVGAQFSSIPINIYTASSNLGDDNTATGTQSGGAIPAGTLNDVAGTITMDLSSWFMNWNNSDVHAGTGKSDGITSAFATGTWDPVTGDYNLSWQSLTGLGPKAGLTSSFTLEGTVSAVPIPPATWLFGSGLLGLFGFIKRKKRYNYKNNNEGGGDKQELFTFIICSCLSPPLLLYEKNYETSHHYFVIDPLLQ
jgi:hypothetical protein